MCCNVLYIHGLGGNPSEAERFQTLFSGRTVVGMDYRSVNPWEAAEELPRLFTALVDDRAPVVLIANSIGAYFAMLSLPQQQIARAYFISPLVDMERMILDRLALLGATEERLRAAGTIAFGADDELSWAYLQYVRAHPIHWNVPTKILRGGCDALIPLDTVQAFVRTAPASVTMLEGSGHWIHTPQELAALDRWILAGEAAAR